MATTRRQPPLQIFQDPVTSTDHHEIATCDSHLLDAFGSITDVSDDHHTLLQPPQTLGNAPSPRKSRHVSSSPPPSALAEKGINTLSLPPPQLQSFRTDSLVKKTLRPVSRQTQAMNGNRPLFTSFASNIDKENSFAIYNDHSLPNLPDPPIPAPPAKHEKKRSLMDAAPLRDRSKKQKVKDTRIEDVGPIPEPDQMPPVEDDGQKPSPSYAQLIGMAILRAPNRQLTLAQIYKWLQDNYAFYRNSQESGWQNSIRHNLSLCKDFYKQERPKDDPGKGHYWVIDPEAYSKYYRVKASRRTTNPDGFVSYPSDMARPSTSQSASFPPPLNVVKSIDSSKFPEETELSSDATIPCSDPAAHDGQEPDRSMPPPRQMASSPPPADIQSSPPAPVARSLRENTPPRASRLPSSRSGGRKRKFNGLGDSGYYSSIESSAIKGNPLGPLLTSEADLDRPSIKRGRAEEEIARIRGSSYDSPSKSRPYGKSQLMSSPFRQADRRSGPLTPAVIFKKPSLPPASASPNTNLRNHRNRMRELVGGSPDKSMQVWVDTSFLNTQNWSPAVTIPDQENFNLLGENFENTFDIFGDFDYQESPLKRSAKRPRLERAATSTGILADITGMKSNIASPTPNWKSNFLNIPSFSPAKMESPMKAPTSTPLPDFSLPKAEAGHSGLTPPQSFGIPQENQDDDIFHLLHSDESEPGFDILQGFQKIGARASVAPNGSPQKSAPKGPAPSRPSLTRSSTVRF